jgi:hypothetical protein
VPIRGKLISPTMRLDRGAWVLSAASAAETRLLSDRLRRFAREHATYAAAHQKVLAVERELRDARAHLSRCDKAGQRAVEVLACALIIDGHRRGNPFARFRVPSPSVVTRLPVAKEAQTVRRLVAAIRGSKQVGEQTLAAVREAEAAARSVERAIVALGKVEEKVRAARLVRDATKHGWHAAYDALARRAQAAADEGAPNLHAKLFRTARRGNRKRRQPRATGTGRRP